MITRINFGLHNSSENFFSVETAAKIICYNFLCAKRHFEHAFAEKPEIYTDGKWQSTQGDNVKGKGWHVILGCIELLPIIGHIAAFVEKFFTHNMSLPSIAPPKEQTVEQPKNIQPNLQNQPSGQNNSEPEKTSTLLPESETSELNDKTIKQNSEMLARKTLGHLWLPETLYDAPPPSPFRDCFFNEPAKDSPDLNNLTELESKALTSIQTLKGLLGLTNPISELPRFPLKLDSPLSHMKLFSKDFINTVEAPISLDFDGDGWPFIVIKVISSQHVARPVLLSCGPKGSLSVEWHGWWEEHCGINHPTFFSQCEFIDPNGELTKYPEKTIQRFKDLLAGQEVEDDHHHKWTLAPTK